MFRKLQLTLGLTVGNSSLLVVSGLRKTGLTRSRRSGGKAAQVEQGGDSKDVKFQQLKDNQETLLLLPLDKVNVEKNSSVVLGVPIFIKNSFRALAYISKNYISY